MFTYKALKLVQLTKELTEPEIELKLLAGPETIKLTIVLLLANESIEPVIVEDVNCKSFNFDKLAKSFIEPYIAFVENNNCSRLGQLANDAILPYKPILPLIVNDLNF